MGAERGGCPRAIACDECAGEGALLHGERRDGEACVVQGRQQVRELPAVHSGDQRVFNLPEICGGAEWLVLGVGKEGAKKLADSESHAPPCSSNRPPHRGGLIRKLLTALVGANRAL